MYSNVVGLTNHLLVYVGNLRVVATGESRVVGTPACRTDMTGTTYAAGFVLPVRQLPEQR